VEDFSSLIAVRPVTDYGLASLHLLERRQTLIPGCAAVSFAFVSAATTSQPRETCDMSNENFHESRNWSPLLSANGQLAFGRPEMNAYYLRAVGNSPGDGKPTTVEGTT